MGFRNRLLDYCKNSATAAGGNGHTTVVSPADKREIHALKQWKPRSVLDAWIETRQGGSTMKETGFFTGTLNEDLKRYREMFGTDAPAGTPPGFYELEPAYGRKGVPDTGRYRFAYAEMFDTYCGFVMIEDNRSGTADPVQLLCRYSRQKDAVSMFSPGGAEPADGEARKIAEEEFRILQGRVSRSCKENGRPGI